MGESIIHAQNDEDKMGTTTPSNPVIDVSVSFGRFENDSLSWEKWSSFSPNKYLEEVEKCATPGSVAKKKAYFEAHYKKIAARKAELLDQERQMNGDPMSSDAQNCVDLIGNSCGTDSEFVVSNSQCAASAEGVKQDTQSASEVSDATQVDELDEDSVITIECQSSLCEEVKQELDSRLDSPKLNKPERVEQETKLASDVTQVSDTTQVDEPDEDSAITIECQSSLLGGVNEEVDSRLDSPKLNKPEAAVFVKEEEETPSMRSQEFKKLDQNPEKQIDKTPKIKKQNVNRPKESRKITPANKERNISRIKKKPESSVSKSPQFSTPRMSRPTPTSTAISVSRSSKKMGNGSTLARTKINPSAGEVKQVAPKSLHMSLSLDPSSSDPASLTTTRKSYIMEKMGDKDIVKRAFKTFQNNYNQLKSSGDERSAVSKQVPVKGRELRVSTSMTPQKENGGSLKGGAVDKKNAKAAPSSFGLKSDDKAEKRREFSKKLEKQSNAREAEKTRLRTKSKGESEADIKKLRQGPNFRATPMPGFYRGQKVLKSPSDKEGFKNDIRV